LHGIQGLRDLTHLTLQLLDISLHHFLGFSLVFYDFAIRLCLVECLGSLAVFYFYYLGEFYRVKWIKKEQKGNEKKKKRQHNATTSS